MEPRCEARTGAATARVFVEIYADQAAFAAHEEPPHTQLFLREREPMLASVRVERLTPVGPA